MDKERRREGRKVERKKKWKRMLLIIIYLLDPLDKICA